MSETVIPGITYLITWIAKPDACVKCLALNGRMWTVDNLETVPSLPAMYSHPHCRCEVDVELDVDLEELQVGEGVEGLVTLEEAKLELEDLKTQVENAKMNYHDVREVEISIIRIGSALERLTGSKEVKQAIAELNRVIWTIRALQIAMNALEIAEGPIGWIYAAATIIGFGVMAGETALGMTS